MKQILEALVLSLLACQVATLKNQPPKGTGAEIQAELDTVHIEDVRSTDNTDGLGTVPVNGLPKEDFSCQDIHLLGLFNRTYGQYAAPDGFMEYWADRVTFICESTPNRVSKNHDTDDTAHVMLWRRWGEGRGQELPANLLKEPVACQRYTFSEGVIPPLEKEKPFATCAEGQNCELCANPTEKVGVLHILRTGWPLEKSRCNVVKDCSTYFLQLNSMQNVESVI
eukprot:TRINITY_DN2278_c3_g1_i1.p1 TRINITY_DN2278_c3_g1~~TRINITY_DN2278_c3_g1_i1.p1  ORF type:complete len:225 (-),score=37.68 TRINITY_DN2278_c3_g1_i1:161-835(-)